MILWNLFGGFLANLIQNAMKELLEAISQIFGDAFYAAFYIEKMEGLSVLTSGAVRRPSAICTPSWCISWP